MLESLSLRETEMEILSKEEGVTASSEHSCCSVLHSLVFWCSTYEERERWRAQVVMLTVDVEKQGLAHRCRLFRIGFGKF